MSTDEMEKYRDKDRQEEADRIAVPNDVNGLIDHYRHEIRKGQKAYDELLKEIHMLRGTKKIVEDLSTENKNLREKEIKKGACTIGEMRKDREEKNDALANALAVNESHQKLNGELQERLTEVEQENIELHTANKKMREHLDKRLDATRKSGM
jgi:hypothetical protein